MESKNFMYGPTILRIFLGILFLVPGINKLRNPSGVVAMLSGLQFPVPNFFAWVLLLSEIIFGLALIFGWKVRYSAWPLIVVLVVASVLVVIPGVSAGQIHITTLLFHLVGIAGLVSLVFTGAGAAAVSKD